MRGSRAEDISDLADVYNCLTACAFLSTVDFKEPPAEVIPSKDELVSGILREFKVPDIEGPLPVLTQADPKDLPQTLKQAMATKYAKFWAQAVVDEWLSIIGHDTWILVDKKPWMKVIPCKWVFAIKTNADGTPTRFKARLVAGGHKQVEGIDYAETYAPVSRMATMRILLSVAANKGWKVHQLDITTAFLHGEIDAEVFMKQPPGFVDGTNLVCKLQRTLYGLKQAPRAWYFKLKSVLDILGFKPVSADSSFWICESKPCIVYISTVVDDMLITSKDEALTVKMVNAILKQLPGKNLGIAKHFNGVKIVWQPESHSVLLYQPSHIQDCIEEFKHLTNMDYGHNLPCRGGLRLCKEGTTDSMNTDDLDTEIYHYRGLLGQLNYLSCCTRPDITYIVNQLARYSNAPKKAHWDIAIGVLKYLKNTSNWGISLGHGSAIDKIFFKMGEPRREVTAFADANHGTGVDDKKSVTGMVIHVLGGPVSWASKMQPVASASSCESEYRAMSATAREALWLAKIVPLFGISAKPFLVCGDNKGAIQSINNRTHTKNTKHIEIHHEFMKDRKETGELEFLHIAGTMNPADILTKALDATKFNANRYALGMRQHIGAE